MRLKAVIRLYRQKKITSASDYHHAALILQHGEEPKYFKLAHKFAKYALTQGDNTARWLFAATLDRWLVSQGKPQRFGTQFRLNKHGEWELATPIDPTVTDEERAKYGIPPLSKALEMFRRKYSLKNVKQVET